LKMIFSELTLDLTGSQHPLYTLRDEMLAAGKTVVDLVRGNASDAGIVFPQDILQEILRAAGEAARIYRPDPFGQETARQAVAAFYSRLKLAPGQILLTPGTSVSYWYCFKLLADPGEEILCPLPSYPLLDYIARISSVRLSYYRLSEAEGWAIDLDYLESLINKKTRAIVLISPHNPTGMVHSQDEIKALSELAARYELPVISDEVFSEFLFAPDFLPRLAETAAPLVFTLNGFSKSFGLPGLKLGWIAVSGDKTLVARALGALEMISDTFLPVSEVSQFAVPGIFEAGRPFQKELAVWVRRGRDLAVDALAGVPLFLPRGGFYLTLSLKQDEDELALRLLQNEQILAHPGHFYEMTGDHLVLTFIQDHACLQDSLSRLRAFL
jgi:alanine-synthesizing transaminase